MMDWLYDNWLWLFYISEWIIRLAMLPVVTRKRQPISAMAWLLAIFLVPWLGLLLYALLGQYRLPRKRTKRHARLYRELGYLGESLAKVSSPLSADARDALDPAARTAVHLAETLGDMPLLAGNDVELISDSAALISRLVADIDAAEHHVHLLYYIFENDQAGGRVLDALTRAVQRGVICRVLVDAVGSKLLLRKKQARAIEAAGIHLHHALPVGLFRRQFARVDLRNHRKVAIIDGSVGYAGSQNLIRPSYGTKGFIWRDLSVRLTGPIVLELQVVFVTDWSFETGEMLDEIQWFPHPALTGDVPIQALPSGPSYPTENYQRLVVDSLYGARQRVTITTPYLVPDEPFLQACQTAVLRGVTVEIILPRRSDKTIINAVSQAYAGQLCEMGVRIHLYEQGLLHAKTMAVDEGIAFIGSSNFDIRSFALDFEINLLCFGSDVTEMLRAQQQAYIADSTELTLKAWHNRPKHTRLIQNISKLFSPLL